MLFFSPIDWISGNSNTTLNYQSVFLSSLFHDGFSYPDIPYNIIFAVSSQILSAWTKAPRRRRRDRRRQYLVPGWWELQTHLLWEPVSRRGAFPKKLWLERCQQEATRHRRYRIYARKLFSRPASGQDHILIHNTSLTNFVVRFDFAASSTTSSPSVSSPPCRPRHRKEACKVL